MLDKTIKTIERLYSVEFIDYRRNGSGVLISSGAGIGMALMDEITKCRFFIDVDRYRFRQDIDWEAIAIHLSARNKDVFFILCGWFTIDVPKTFNRFEKGILTKYLRYDGGSNVSLREFLSSCEVSGFL